MFLPLYRTAVHSISTSVFRGSVLTATHLFNHTVSLGSLSSPSKNSLALSLSLNQTHSPLCTLSLSDPHHKGRIASDGGAPFFPNMEG